MFTMSAFAAAVASPSVYFSQELLSVHGRAVFQRAAAVVRQAAVRVSVWIRAAGEGERARRYGRGEFALGGKTAEGGDDREQ